MTEVPHRLPWPTGHLTGGIPPFSLGINSHCNSPLGNITQLLTQVSAFAIAVQGHYRWLDSLLNFLLLPYFSTLKVLLLYLHYFIGRGIRRFKASVRSLQLGKTYSVITYIHTAIQRYIQEHTCFFPSYEYSSLPWEQKLLKRDESSASTNASGRQARFAICNVSTMLHMSSKGKIHLTTRYIVMWN